LLDGYEHAYIFRSPNAEDVECVECNKFDGKPLNLEHLSVTDLPPWHDNCECQLSLYPVPTSTQLLDFFADSNEEEDLTAKEERCVISVKRDLIKRHPTWSEGRIKSSAIAICRAAFEPGTKRKKRDASTGEKMNKRCLAAAKSEIRSKNPSFSASKVNALAQEICKMHALDPSPGTLVK
jgi:hypothetical protein